MKRSTIASWSAATAALAPIADAAIMQAEPFFSDGGPIESAGTTWDIDGGGAPDFEVFSSVVSAISRGAGLKGIPLASSGGSGALRGAPTPYGFFRLDSSVSVNTSYRFLPGGLFTVNGTTLSAYLLQGGWEDNGSGYFGFSFTMDGARHAGWGRLEIDQLDGSVMRPGTGFRITDAYYESTPNTPIHVGSVPEPSGLVLLACGAVGVLARRKRREA